MSERVTPAQVGAANKPREQKSGQERKLAQSCATTPRPGDEGVGNLESWARADHQRGLAIIPLRPRSKAPAIARWQERRLGLDELLSCLRGDGAG